MCCLKCTLQSILDGSPDYSGIEYYLDSLGEEGGGLYTG